VAVLQRNAGKFLASFTYYALTKSLQHLANAQVLPHTQKGNNVLNFSFARFKCCDVLNFSFARFNYSNMLNFSFTSLDNILTELPSGCQWKNALRQASDVHHYFEEATDTNELAVLFLKASSTMGSFSNLTFTTSGSMWFFWYLVKRERKRRATLM
jgi:hypothetical protein